MEKITELYNYYKNAESQDIRDISKERIIVKQNEIIKTVNEIIEYIQENNQELLSLEDLLPRCPPTPPENVTRKGIH
jgi:hypothetical protein